MSEPIQIPVVIDNTKANQSLEQVGEKAVQQTKKVDTAVKGLGKEIASTSAVVSGAIGSVTAGVAAHEQAWTTVGTTVLGSFAAGGPIGGALAILGTTIGVLTSKTGDFTSSFESDVERLVREVDKLRSANSQLEREILGARGFDLMKRDIKAAAQEAGDFDRRLNVAKASLQFAKHQNADPNLPLVTLKPYIDDVKTLEKALKGARERVKELVALQAQRSIKVDEDGARRIHALNDKIRDQVSLMESLRTAEGDFGRFRAQLLHESEKLLDQGASPRAVGLFRDEATKAFFQEQENAAIAKNEALAHEVDILNTASEIDRARLNIARETQEALNAIQIPEGASEELKELLEQQRMLIQERGQAKLGIVETEGPGGLEKFTSSIQDQSASALAAGLTDGALNGFQNAQSIAKSLFSNIGNQGLNLLVKAGFNFLGSFAEGGDFVADRPSFIQVGERGAERVRVEPLTGARAGQNGGGTSSPDNVSLTLNVQGGLGNLSRQEVKNLVKQAYMEVATRGNSVRRINASQSKRSLY